MYVQSKLLNAKFNCEFTVFFSTVIPGSWKRPADADESLERVETSADMLKHMKQAEIEQREAKDKAKEDGKRQRRVQKEMYGEYIS